MKKVKLTLNEELSQMKRVMSMLLNEDGSQNINDYPVCVRTFGSPRETKQYSMTYRIFGTGNWDRYVFSSGGLNPEVIKPDGIRDNYYCDRYGHIQLGKNYGTEFENREKQNNELEKGKTQSQINTKAAADKVAASKKVVTTNQKTAVKTKSKVKYVKSNDLKDVKAFQDWLDANKSDEQLGQGKGWAAGFPNGKLNKGKGYGTYGPRSNAAWEKYGNEYGQVKKLTLAPEGQSKVDTQNAQLWGQQTDIQGNPVNPQISRPS